MGSRGRKGVCETRTCVGVEDGPWLLRAWWWLLRGVVRLRHDWFAGCVPVATPETRRCNCHTCHLHQSCLSLVLAASPSTPAASVHLATCLICGVVAFRSHGCDAPHTKQVARLAWLSASNASTPHSTHTSKHRLCDALSHVNTHTHPNTAAPA